MRIFHVTALGLLFLSSSLLSQDLDSLVKFSELTFSSEFERKVFDDVQKGSVDPFLLLIANGNLLTDSKIAESKARFYEHINSIKLDEGKKNEKRIKYVYDNLHKKFLLKFELKNRFEEVFYNGYYNSISATAIHALTFDKLKIPYHIIEEPSQVYLIAYPDAEKIVVKSAPEMGGYFELNDEFKQSYIKLLKDQKLIPAQEYASSSLKELFDKYYFDQVTDITLKQLAALQYINDGLFLGMEKKFETAFNQIEKAFVLYPSDRLGYLLMVNGVQAFESHKAKDSLQAIQLSKLSRYKVYGIEPDMIATDFTGIIQKLLFEEGATEKYETYYRVLSRSIRDPKLKEQIIFLHQFHYGRYFYSQGKFHEAVPFFEKAMTLKPADLNTQTLFLSSLGNTLNGRFEYEEIATQLEAYNTRFPNLQGNNNFNTMMATTYLYMFYQNYNQNKIVVGDKYKLLFENLATKHPDMVISPALIAQSYSEAATYHYRKGQVARARQIIAAGLKYAPNSYELKTRQQMIK